MFLTSQRKKEILRFEKIELVSKVNDGIKGKKVGILLEGFQVVEEDLAVIVRGAAEDLKAAGAEVGEVSLPIHNDGLYVFILDYLTFLHFVICTNGYRFTR